MADDPPQPVELPPGARTDRLDSWKEIAAHLNRGVSTVQRWERLEGLPVHRHRHSKLGSVWASRAEVDAWWHERQSQLERQPDPPAPRLRAVRWSLAAALVAAALLAAFWLRPQPQTAKPALLRPAPLTSLEGREYDPALSPDGRQLAYVGDGEGEGSFVLYVLALGEAAPRRLTNGDGSVACPAFSPDGRSIAYVRQKGDEATVVITPVAGGDERTVASLSTWFGTALAWSADGKAIAYPDRRTPDGPYAIFLRSLETGDSRRLTEPESDSLGDALPSYSDDGRTLAFARVAASGDALPGDIFVQREGEERPTQVTHGAGLVGGLDWAPGGLPELIYSAVSPGEPPRLYRVAVGPGSVPVALEGAIPSDRVAETVSQPSRALRLSVARQGRRVAFVKRSYDTNIWSLEGASSAAMPHRLIASTQPDEGPQFSPDGRRIAFASSRAGAPEIWTCRNDGGECAALTRAGVHSGTPRWSPDGRRIAFDSRPGSQSDVFVVEVESGKVTQVTSAEADDVVPSFSRDGQRIYFASNRSGSWQVYATGVEGGAATRVTQLGGFCAFEGERGAVYYTRHDEPGLWRVPREGGAESRVLDAPRCWGQWALARDGVYFLDAEDGVLPARLDFFSFALGRRTRLRDLGQAAPCAESSLAVSADGRAVLYVATEEGSDILGVTWP